MTRRAILATCVVLLYGTISDYGAWTMFKVLAEPSNEVHAGKFAGGVCAASAQFYGNSGFCTGDVDYWMPFPALPIEVTG